MNKTRATTVDAAANVVGAALILMVLLTLSVVFNTSFSAFSIFIGIASFFVAARLRRLSLLQSGLDISSVPASLSEKALWPWLLLPFAVNVVSFVLSKSFLPEYIEYETRRAGGFVAIELTLQSVLLFLVFALGEEIAWRAFFQQEVKKHLNLIPALAVTSLFFTLGHFTHDAPFGVAAFGLVFTFVNSLLFGVVFHKTNNAWVSALVHFAANIFEVSLYLFLA